MRVILNNDKQVKVYTSKQFRYVKTKQLRKFSFKKPCTYMDKAIYLDTETSHVGEDIAWIYQWAFEFYGQYIIGRNAEQLTKALKRITDIYHLDHEHRVICYIHNLSYDIVYMIDWLRREYDEEPEILAVDRHKVLTCYIGGIEFRCSYLLSNMSLDGWSKKLNTSTRKMVGAIDYSEIHYPDDNLTQVDWEYQINDVQTLKECVEMELRGSGDTLATIPLTSTGYVRRDLRIACKKDETYWDYFQKTRLDAETFRMANNAFAGGYTHGNRYLVNTTLNGNIGHFDYKSHYPSREELDYMPASKFVIYYDEELEEDKMTRRELNELCKEKCVLMTVALYDVTIKKGITAPMLSVSGAHNVNYKFKADNGRILKIFGDIPAIYTFTELDYKWLRKQYKYKMTIIKVATAKRGRCPEPIREVTNKYFEIKETLSEGYFYMKSKNKLNAIYGCSATNPVRSKIDWDLDTGLWKITNKDDDTSIQEALDKYYGSRNNFMPYQIGVYTTAHARNKLFTIIEKIVGYKNFIYADTDSIFCYVTDEIKAKIHKYNKDIIRLNKNFNLGVKNKKGTISYYGTFEDEHDDINQFRFLHSKCYAFTNDSGLHCTIAGVTSNNRLPSDHPDFITREQELGSIDALVPGKKFIACGGTRSIYYHAEPKKKNINGHIVPVASGCIIANVDKTMSSTIEEVVIWEQSNI